MFLGSNNDKVIVNGTCRGVIKFQSNTEPEIIENAGTIEGTRGPAISSSQFAITTGSGATTLPSSGMSVVNSGLDAVVCLGNPHLGKGDVEYAALYFDDSFNSFSTINNQGTITGNGYVIVSTISLPPVQPTTPSSLRPMTSVVLAAGWARPVRSARTL
jgi:hypothetical protein